MKVFYNDGENKFICVDRDPLLSYEKLESGKVIMWYDKTINSLINKSV